jgi:hypothetical protein
MQFVNYIGLNQDMILCFFKHICKLKTETFEGYVNMKNMYKQ